MLVGDNSVDTGGLLELWNCNGRLMVPMDSLGLENVLLESVDRGFIRRALEKGTNSPWTREGSLGQCRLGLDLGGH